MATTAGTLNIYDSYGRELHKKNVNVTTDTFIMGLSTNLYVPNKSAHEALADITNEVSGGGYARQTLTGVSLIEATPGVWRFDANNPIFTAAGGNIVARYWWLFNDAATSPLDMLCFYGLLDDTPADVTTTDGNSLTVQLSANGFTQLNV